MLSNAVGGGGTCTLSLAWDGAVMMPLQFYDAAIAKILLYGEKKVTQDCILAREVLKTR